VFSEEVLELLKTVLDVKTLKLKRLPSFYLFLATYKLGLTQLEGVFASNRTLYHLGVGKSVYALKVMTYVYRDNWNVVQDHIVFLPHDFLRVFEKAIDGNYRIPILLWDDAGFWLGKQRWQSAFVRNVREFLNLIRTHVCYIFFTAPKINELARGIREQLNYVNYITLFNYSLDITKRQSKSLIYHGEDALLVYARNKTKPNPISEYIFKVYYPYYDKYEEIRKMYVKVGDIRAREEFKKVSERALIEMQELMKKAEVNKKVDNVIDESEVKDMVERVVNEEID